eukprot:scaffold627842_cov28-Attheya_sp.AAC.1
MAIEAAKKAEEAILEAARSKALEIQTELKKHTEEARRAQEKLILAERRLRQSELSYKDADARFTAADRSFSGSGDDDAYSKLTGIVALVTGRCTTSYLHTSHYYLNPKAVAKRNVLNQERKATRRAAKQN